MTTQLFSVNAQQVAHEIGNVLQGIDSAQIDRYIAELQGAETVFYVGVGRVLLALETAVKRLNHLGIHAYTVGALNEPPIGTRDLLVVGSGSGESIYPRHIAQCAKSYGARIVHLTSNPGSSIAQLADVIVDFHCGSKASAGAQPSIQPMTTLFEQSLVVFGDVVCLHIMTERGLSFADVSRNHANLE